MVTRMQKNFFFTISERLINILRQKYNKFSVSLLEGLFSIIILQCHVKVLQDNRKRWYICMMHGALEVFFKENKKEKYLAHFQIGPVNFAEHLNRNYCIDYFLSVKKKKKKWDRRRIGESSFCVPPFQKKKTTITILKT